MKTTSKSARAADTRFMEECLRLAPKGRGSVEPNPMVGAVVVKNGIIIGRGYHRKYGGPHAEINALRSCRRSPRGATLYVNMEPCVHHGKTPPCTDAILRSGLRRVVVGMTDPNPLVAGRGVRVLRRSGISVTTNVLRASCEKLNECFVKYISTGLPFVTLKVAQTTDGRVADHQGNSQWITGEWSRVDVHHLRSQAESVLVGSRTVLADNPRLSVRYVRGGQPLRVVLDGSMKIPPVARVFTSLRTSPTILITTGASVRRHPRKVSTLRKKGVTIVAFDVPRSKGIPVRAILRVLGGMGITSVVVEGGPETWGRFLNERCADKILLYTAPLLIGGNRGAFAGLMPGSLHSAIELTSVSAGFLGRDLLVEGYVSYKKRRK